MKKLCVAVCILTTSLVASAQVQKTSPEVQHAVAVLSSMFETVAYTETDFLKDAAEPTHKKFVEDETALKSPFDWLMIALMSGNNQQRPANPTEINTRLLTAVTDFDRDYYAVASGAKDFKFPEGLGMYGFHTSYICIARDGNPPSMEPSFRQTRHETIGGHTSWVWEIEPEEAFPKNTINFYATQIGPYFVVSNDRATFEETLKTIQEPGNTKPTFAQWDPVSTHAYWVHRAVRQSDKALEGMVPGIQTVTLYTDHFDQNAKVDFQVTQRPTISTLTTAATTPSTLRLGKGTQPLTSEGPGHWHTAIALSKVPLDEDRTTETNIFLLVEMLGYGMAI